MGIVDMAATLERALWSRLKLREFTLSREGKILLGLIAVGAFFRLFLLGSKSIWLDEAYSIAMGRRGLFDLLSKVIEADTHPPLYYAALKLWMIAGAGEGYVRLFSALFSIAAIPVMYALTTAIFGDKQIGLVGAAILAFSPFQVWYAQETRMYAMLTFLVLLSAYFFFRALQTCKSGYWIGYVIITVLALYTDNGAIWYVAAVSIFYLASMKRFPGNLLSWFLSNLAIGLLYFPWLPFFLLQARQVTESFWLPAPSFGTVLRIFLDFHSLNFPLTELSLLYLAVIFVWAAIVPARDWHRRLALIWLLIPIAISLLLSLRQSIILSRNLIIASLGYYLLIAAMIWMFKSRRAALAFLLLLVAMNLVSIGYNAWWEKKEDWRTVADYVARSAQTMHGGSVVFIPSYTELPFSYYYEGYDVPVETQGYPGDELLLHPKPRQVEDIAKALEGRPYVWLVVRDIESVDPNWTVKSWLDSNGYVRQKDLVLENISVLTYIRWDKAPPGNTPISAGTSTKSFMPLIQRDEPLDTYEVKRGEILLEIAVRYQTTVQRLMELNDLKDPNDIEVGQMLLVPAMMEGTPYP